MPGLSSGVSVTVEMNKYVVFSSANGKKFIFTFPKEFMHSEMAKAITHAARRDPDHPTTLSPVSAGFCEILDSRCFGKSESMDLDSVPALDQLLLEDV